MVPASDAADPVTGFIARMVAALCEDETKGIKPPIERRRLRTITSECGQRASSRFREHLHQHLMEAGVYTEPPLVDLGLRLDDWVLFSTGPFPPDAAFFPREKDLQSFVEACLGSGVFRNLESYRPHGRTSCREYRLPNGDKIDLLCQERTRSGTGALVAVELKRERERGTVEQMISYLNALKALFPSRAIKGVIISGREDQVASALLSGITDYDIKWYCYQVTFEQLSTT